MRRYLRWGLPLMLLVGLVACGGGGGDSVPAPEPPTPLGKAEASRFLQQATFGPKLAEINALASATSYETWLEQQRLAPVSLELPYLQSLKANGEDVYQNARMDIWWRNAVRGPDQLRQRMAFALSEILVVSDQAGPLNNDVEGLGNYYDILARNALGNYRTLLEEVTLSIPMGRYLSMYQNQKPDPDTGLRADENYAREVMQLFTIGLVQLNLDGSVKKDGNGQPIPTYKQADVEGLARVFTGFSHAHDPSDSGDYDFFYGAGGQDSTRPMEPWQAFHDTGAKQIVGNTPIPAGLAALPELRMALDVLFNHPNVGPFIGRQLIQRLVTSNPSPAYVQRVATVFNDNGRGVRGDLYAVLRAILLDAEARKGNVSLPESFGKLREPLLRATQVWRAFDAVGKNGRYDFWNPEYPLAQAPLRSPSVFNFFRPGFQPVALIGTGLVCPECQITNEASVTELLNQVDSFAYHYRTSLGEGSEYYGDTDILLDFRPWEARVNNAGLASVIEDLDLIFTGGQLGAPFRQELMNYVMGRPESEVGDRLYELVHLITSSAQYAVQQ